MGLPFAGLAAGDLVLVAGPIRFIAPLLRIVFSALLIESEKEAIQVVIFGVLEVFCDQRRSIRVMKQVVVEELLTLGELLALVGLLEYRLVLREDMIDERTQERDVAAGAQRCVN